MANLNNAYMNLKNPNAMENQEFMQAQGTPPGLVPQPAQAPIQLMNATPRAMPGAELNVPQGANRMSDTQTQQTSQKLKSYMDSQKWETLIQQALQSEPIQMQKQAVDEGDARAKEFEERTKGIDTNNYSAIGMAADQLNQINGTKTNYAGMLAEQAAKNDPRKIQETIIKNYQDAQKGRAELGKETLGSVKAMSDGELSNKLADTQMAGIQAFNPGMVNQRNLRMFEQQRDALLKDPELLKIGVSLRSVGNGLNQIADGQKVDVNTVHEIMNILNSVAGAGNAGLTGAERSAMSGDNMGFDLTKLESYLTNPQSVPGGFSNPWLQRILDRAKAENQVLSEQFENRVKARVENNAPLYDIDPRFKPEMMGVADNMINAVKINKQSQKMIDKLAPQGQPLADKAIGKQEGRTGVMSFEEWKKAHGR